VALALRADRFQAALVLIWGFAALRSARHVPFFAIVAAPVLAAEGAARWRRFSAGAGCHSPWRISWEISQDLGRLRHASVWLPALAAAALLVPSATTAGFPDTRFPVRAVECNQARLAPAGAMPRVLTSDQWADYLIFRLYPRQRVFFDGRSDFYGPAIGADYRRLLGAQGAWRPLLDRYGFELALLPGDWPLASFLGREPGWREVYRDSVAVLYAREGSRP